MDVVYIEKLCRYYNRGATVLKAVDNINLTIGKGVTALSGASGSGKTTLMNLIGGLDVPTYGTVKIGTTDLSIFDDENLTIFRRRNIGYIFQDYNMVPILNVYENIALPLLLDGRDIDYEYISILAQMLRIQDKLYDYADTLSGGQQQRATIARALATKPKLILADEPTGSLDSKASQDVMAMLKMLCKEFDQTVVVITHDNEVADLADRRIYIEDGRVKESKATGYGQYAGYKSIVSKMFQEK